MLGGGWGGVVSGSAVMSLCPPPLVAAASPSPRDGCTGEGHSAHDESPQQEAGRGWETWEGEAGERGEGVGHTCVGPPALSKFPLDRPSQARLVSLLWSQHQPPRIKEEGGGQCEKGRGSEGGGQCEKGRGSKGGGQCEKGMRGSEGTCLSLSSLASSTASPAPLRHLSPTPLPHLSPRHHVH